MSFYLTQEPHELILDWICERTGLPNVPDDTNALGVVRDDTHTLAAALGINCIQTHTANVHLVTDGTRDWMQPRVLQAFAAFVFRQHRMPRVVAPVSDRRRDMQVMLLRAGFEFEARDRGGAPDGSDAILMSMTAATCTWLRRGEQEEV